MTRGGATAAGDGGTFQVALTFDVEHPDRPTVPGVTERILDALDRDDVLATTFIQGRWAEAYPELTASIAQAGHLIANHSFYHVRAPLLTAEGFATDVREAGDAIRGACGVDPAPWFRFPFGAGSDDPGLLAQLDDLGYRSVYWDVDGYDWDTGDAAELEKRLVVQTIARGDGTIVLLHGWPKRTAKALPRILAQLADAGADFVTVDALELVHISGARRRDVRTV